MAIETTADRRLANARTDAGYTLGDLRHTGSLGSKKQARVRRAAKTSFTRAARRATKAALRAS